MWCKMSLATSSMQCRLVVSVHLFDDPYIFFSQKQVYFLKVSPVASLLFSQTESMSPSCCYNRVLYIIVLLSRLICVLLAHAALSVHCRPCWPCLCGHFPLSPCLPRRIALRTNEEILRKIAVEGTMIWPGYRMLRQPTTTHSSPPPSSSWP